jgi:hypothetical protein
MRESDGKGIVRVPDLMLSPFWARLAGDRALDEYIKRIVRFEEYEGDPYNMAAAAYYGAEAVQVYVPENHPYSRKDPQALKDQIIMPVRSFVLRMRQMIPKRKGWHIPFTKQEGKFKE